MTKEDKWRQNYIENIDLQNITWITLEKDNFLEFINQNYFDEELGEYVIGEDPEIPFGMHYVADIQNQSTKYLLGIVPNSIRKFTIVAACMYDENYHFFADQTMPMTYIITTETNQYFHKMGLYHLLCEVISQTINHKIPIVCSNESEEGKICHTFQILKTTLEKNGFHNAIITEEELFEKPLEYQKTIKQTNL